MIDRGDIVLEATGMSKSFPGVKALDDVTITLRSGHLTALLGENGAGKSTLMNTIAGVFPADSGEVRLGGEVVSFSNPREALDAGIAMIFQELNLVSNLTVAANIFLGREPMNRFGFIDAAKMNRDAARLLDELDLDVAPTTPLGQLRVGQQQIVEIAKALSCDARVLIMDEPTSAITEHEIEVLFGIVEKLKAQGVAVIFVEQKVEAALGVADRIAFLEHGRVQATATPAALHADPTPLHRYIGVGLAGAPFFLSAEPLYQTLGALLFLAHSVLDGCDGELARLRSQQTRLGGLLDFWGDNVVHATIFFFMGLGWSDSSGSTWPVLVGAVASVTTLATAWTVYVRTMRERAGGGPMFTSVVRSKASSAARVVDALGKRDFIYLILACAAFGKARSFRIMGGGILVAASLALMFMGESWIYAVATALVSAGLLYVAGIRRGPRAGLPPPSGRRAGACWG